jgi:hypothetical protein
MTPQGPWAAGNGHMVYMTLKSFAGQSLLQIATRTWTHHLVVVVVGFPCNLLELINYMYFFSFNISP